MCNCNELNIVTEVGMFGELNIEEDPTSKKVKKKNEDLDALIEEAIITNKSIEK